MNTIDSGRILLIINNTYPAKVMRDTFSNPMVLLTSKDKLLYLLWSQLYSDVFIMNDGESDQKIQAGNNIEEYLANNFDMSMIYSDNEKFYFAKQLPDYILKYSQGLKKAIEEKDLPSLVENLPNNNVGFIEQVLCMSHPKPAPTIDYTNEHEIQNNIHNGMNYYNLLGNR